MHPEVLLFSTGVPSADAAVARVIETYRAAFVGRPISFYLIGSYAEGTANDLSDIDLIAASVGWSLGDEARDRVEALRPLLPTSIRIDVALIAAQDLGDSHVGVNVKHAGQLVYGDDIRGQIQLPPLDVYQRHVTEAACDFIVRVLRGGNTIGFPLQYPEPNDEFFGYARVRLTPWYPPGLEYGLKELVSTATRIATALVALQGGRYVSSKAESIRLYQDVIGDEWAGYLSLLYDKGKIEWGYRVPQAAEDRALLHDLCARFLGFERHFLSVAGTSVDL